MRERLLRKLRYVEALFAGATTPGERAAASRAKRRLLGRLGRPPQPHEHRPPWDPRADAALASCAAMPCSLEFACVLSEWAHGALSALDVAAWAAWHVDKVLLPDYPPHDVRSIPVEVLLQLSAMRHQPLTVDDLPAIRRFLGAGPGEALAAWRTWLAHLAGIDWRARR